MALIATDELARMREGMRRFASGFTPGQKAVTVTAVVAALVLGIVYMLVSGKPSYAPLFTNLQPQDAAAITQKLTSDHVPYQLQDGGSTILVPQNDVAQERLSAAEAGLPTQSTVGLSLLDKEGLTTSQLTQQADYLQAIQGELEQTIDAISGVTSSQVNVAMPADQTFALNNTNPTGASVLITLDPGHSLSQNEVQAVVHLVSSSVPGLSASDVTVADSNGNLLAGPGVAAGAGQNGQVAAFDSSQEAKAQAYLASVFGAGNFDVQVNASLNFNQVSTSTQSIIPGSKGAPQSFCTSTDQSNTNYTGTGTPTGGAAGTVTSPSITGGSGNYSQTSNNQTCETDTQTQTETQAPGGVIDQSVAVLVNSTSVPKGADLASIRSGIAAAVNLRPDRGDVLSFTVAPFNTSAATQTALAAKAAAQATSHAGMVSMMKDAIAVLIVLAAILLIWLSSRRRRALDATRVVDVPALEIPAAMPLTLEDRPTGELVSLRTGARNDRLSISIEEFIDDQPEEVASVLRNWLQRGATAAEVFT